MRAIFEARYKKIIGLILVLRKNLLSSLERISPYQENDAEGMLLPHQDREAERILLKAIIIKLNILHKKIEAFHEDVAKTSDNTIDHEHSVQIEKVNEWANRAIKKINNQTGSGIDTEKYTTLSNSNKELLLENLKKLECLTNLKQLTPSEKMSLCPDLWSQGDILQAQQMAANENPQFQDALQKTFELTKKLDIKISCFFSYAWATDERKYEKWVTNFLKILSDHLETAGIRTLLDVRDSTSGNTKTFMLGARNAHTAILFITDSLHDKLLKGVSSVCKEYNLLLQRRRDDWEKNRVTFFPITLSSITEREFPSELERFTVIKSFPDEGYMAVFIDLLRHLYKFGNKHTAFNQIWDVILPFSHTIPKKLTPSASPYFSQPDPLTQLKPLLSCRTKSENIDLLQRDIQAHLIEIAKKVIRNIEIKCLLKQKNSIFLTLKLLLDKSKKEPKRITADHCITIDHNRIDSISFDFFFQEIDRFLSDIRENFVADSIKITKGEPVQIFKESIDDVINLIKHFTAEIALNKKQLGNGVVLVNLRKATFLLGRYDAIKKILDNSSPEKIFIEGLALLSLTKKMLDEILPNANATSYCTTTSNCSSTFFSPALHSDSKEDAPASLEIAPSPFNRQAKL